MNDNRFVKTTIIRRLTGLVLRHPVTTVALWAAVLRMVVLDHVPLVVTNDSVGYATWALTLLDGRFPELPHFRTPGYSLFLAGVLAVGGYSPFVVLTTQHALGVATCAAVAALAKRAAGPAAGLFTGALVAADPRLLGLECYLLTETLATSLYLVAAWLAITPRGPVWARAVLLGAALAGLCLVRPAFQVASPFLALALLSRCQGLRPLATAAALLCLSAGLILSPWLAHNHRKGINGLSGGSGVFFWLGARYAGLIDDNPPPLLRPVYDRHLRGEPPQSDNVYPFLAEAGAWSDATVQAALDEWRARSVRAVPGQYLAAVGVAALWQLDIYPVSGGVRGSELRWYLWRLAGRTHPRSDAPNFQFNVNGEAVAAFAMHEPPGTTARLLRRAGAARVWPTLNLILFGSAMAAGVMALVRRQWSWALVLASSGAYFGAHVLALLPYSRFSLPLWTLWYTAPALLILLVKPHGFAHHRD